MLRRAPHSITVLFIGAAGLAACGDGSDSSAELPQLTAATPATFSGDCASLAGAAAGLAATQLTSATLVAAGTLGGVATPEHCRIAGKMHERVGPVDGVTYAIGFEIRLPRQWNGRFFYQANGGTDGTVVTATGAIGGAGATESALSRGFAVMSSDAGHSSGGSSFGLDPQARLDFGYNAVAQLTPAAKTIIKAVYGKEPDRSYFGGCSNGGRHAMVAAARFADQYDGILAGDPGFNLPRSSLGSIWGVQHFALVATGTVNETVTTSAGTTVVAQPDISTAFTPAEMNTVAAAVLNRCDALDGAADGIVGNTRACQAAFDLRRDVSTCSGARDGSCLTSSQKAVLADVFAGPRNTAGQKLYTTYPFDAGIGSSNWRLWKFFASINAGLAGGVPAFVHSSPPYADTVVGFAPINYLLGFSMDTDAPKFFSPSGIYTESAISFLTPPDPTDLSHLKNRGAKLLVYHGVSDGIFSFDDTREWYEALTAAEGGDAKRFARFFAVPQMAHCSGGPSTDKFDMLGPLVDWVERGVAPDTVVASARGAGTASANTEVPASWSSSRSRPLCAWPEFAKYRGTGSLEDAASFACAAP